MTHGAEQPASHAARTYRPDIDGLRAVAVLSVIVFHLSRPLLPGGFVGVDIFFVISGFLITSHILEEINRGAFSLAGFYGRRIKRIAPPMLVVVGLTLLAAKVLMLPEDAAGVAKSGVWSLSSLANVFFWRYQDTGYFAAQGQDLPLLHLWSLGVEEQFYIIWPLLLMTFYRAARAKAFLVGMTIAAIVSFALGNLLFGRDPSFVYYMLPTRAGELLLGAMAANATVTQQWSKLPRTVVLVAAVAGMLMIAGSLAFLTEDSVFPGILAVPPTLGTALLIAAGRDSRALNARVLSFKPLVMVGLISYSAYLWHWPLLTFYRYGYGNVGIGAGVTLFVLTLLLAYMSYRFVEQPARRSKASVGRIFTRQYVVPAGVIGAGALAMIYADRVWPSQLKTPYRTALARLRDQSRPAYEYPYVCQRQKLELTDITDPRCVLGPVSTDEPSILLWGDSNAAHYVGVLGAFARADDFRFRNVEVGGCPPLLSDPKPFVETRRTADCVASAAVVRPLVDRAAVLIISASYTTYQAHSDRFLETWLGMVRDLVARGKHVIIVGKAPVLPGFDRRCREKALKVPLLQCPTIQAPLAADVARTNDTLPQFAARTPNVAYFDANRYLCPSNVCSSNAANGEPLYYDLGHLSLEGSWALGEMIVRTAGVPAQFQHLDRR